MENQKTVKEIVLGQSKVSSEFQFQLIKGARPHMQIAPGEYVEFVLKGDDVVIRRREKL